MDSIDRILAALARPQGSAFSFQQALGAGVSKSALDRRRRRGTIVRRHPSTYIFGCDAGIPETENWAAVLGAGPGALLCREAAAYQWGLSRRLGPPPPDVVVSSRQRPLQGVSILQSRTVHPEDRAIRNGIPITTVERTIVDLADQRSVPALCRYLREGRYREVLDFALLERTMERNAGRRGARRMRAALHRFLHGDNGCDNRGEARFLTMLANAGVHDAVANKELVLSGTTVRPDVWIEHAGLAIELDERSHALEPVVREDQLKDALYRANGIPFVRVLDNDPEEALRVVLFTLDELRLRT